MPLQPPPRDAAGKVEPHDHPEILADDVIIRRISRQQVVRGGDGRDVISSIAYQESSEDGEGMSVDIEKLIVEDGIDPKAFVMSPSWIGAVHFFAGFLRDEELKVGFDPIPPGDPDENPYHGQVWGKFPKTKKQRLKLAAQWYVEAAGVLLFST